MPRNPYRNRCPFIYQYQLAEWAAEYFSRSLSYFKRMSKRQLLAIWYKEEERRRDRRDKITEGETK